MKERDTTRRFSFPEGSSATRTRRRNDTSATELVRDAPDSDRRRKTELTEAAEKRGKLCRTSGVAQRRRKRRRRRREREREREKENASRCQADHRPSTKVYTKEERDRRGEDRCERATAFYHTDGTRCVRVSHADTTRCNIGISEATVCVRYTCTYTHVSVRYLERSSLTRGFCIKIRLKISRKKTP